MSEEVSRWDAIIVGSGLTGSTAALEFAQLGCRTAVIEAGHLISDAVFEPKSSHRSLFDPRYQLFRLKLLLKGDRQNALSAFVNRDTSRFFLSSSDRPYSTSSGDGFQWTRTNVVGGRSHFWGRVLLRFTEADFKRRDRAWPIELSDLAPDYAAVEEILEVGGDARDNELLGDQPLSHCREINKIEQLLVDSAREIDPRLKSAVNRVAGYHPGPLPPMLAAALATTNVTLFPRRLALEITFDESSGRPDGITCINLDTLAFECFRSPRVALAASSFESVSLLKRSRSVRYPDGVGGGSGHLGRRILEHMMASVTAELPKSLRTERPIHSHNPFQLNAAPHGFYLRDFAGQEEDERHRFGIQGVISPDTGLFYIGAFGESTPNDDNHISLEENSSANSAESQPQIQFRWSASDLSLHDHCQDLLDQIVDRFEMNIGKPLVRPMMGRVASALTQRTYPVPGSNHESGGARMGVNSETSVVDPFCRVWEAPNVIVCDAACFPFLPAQNPTLTAMALAKRAVRNLVMDG